MQHLARQLLFHHEMEFLHLLGPFHVGAGHLGHPAQLLAPVVPRRRENVGERKCDERENEERESVMRENGGKKAKRREKIEIKKK